MDKFTKRLGIVLLFGMIVSSGCSTAPKPFEYRSDNELKQGPGLISGEEEKFIMYHRPVSLEALPSKKD
ncbi:hypothetical protein ACFL0M_10945 [Thermodesulfobacteriota bacterium]